MEIVNIIFSTIGAIASALGIYQFVSHSTKSTNLPALNTQPKFDGDQVVLILDKNDKDKEGTLAHTINSFIEEYKPSEENTPYFIYNPKGFYMADQIRFSGKFSCGSGMAILGILFIIQEYFRFRVGDLSYNSGPHYVLGYAFLILSILPFYLSLRKLQKMKIVKRYIMYLAHHEISVGVRMTQSREKYNANKAN